MTDNIASSAVVCIGGYDSSMNHLNMDTSFPGRASDLLNYEPGLNGGYRKLSGFMPFDVNFQFVDDTNAEGPILGVFIYRRSDTHIEEIIAARKQKSGTTYNFYKYTLGGWVPFVTGLTLNTISGAKQVIKIRYDTWQVGGGSYLILADGVNNLTIYDGTTWKKIDPLAAGGAGTPGGDQAIDSPAYVAVFKNHIFVARDFDSREIVAHSAPLDPYTWTAAGGGGQLPVGFEISQIRPFRDQLFVFGYNEISNITVANDAFVVNDTTKNIGCIAPDSVIEISGDLLFLSPDGIRPVSATDRNDDYQLASVSKQIQFNIQNLINSYDLSLVDSVVIRGKSQFRYFFNSTSEAIPSRGIVGGIRSVDNSSAGGWEFSRLQGIRTSCSTSGFVDREETVLHGGYDGGVYQQEVGNSFNGENILSIYETPFLTFGDAKIRKMLRTISIYYRLEGSLEMNIGAKFDWNDAEVLSPINFTQSNISTVSIYGDGSKYGDGSVYASVIQSPLMQTDIEGSFHSVKLSFTTSDQNPSHSIQGFVLEYTTQARR